jgi:hypothetical protein
MADKPLTPTRICSTCHNTESGSWYQESEGLDYLAVHVATTSGARKTTPRRAVEESQLQETPR